MSEEKSNGKTIIIGGDSDNNWAFGIALILLGTLYMLDSLNILHIHLYNWWAIFILVPGLSMAAKGWREYRETQDHASRKTGFWGLALIAFAIALFFGINWNLLFPIGLVGVGLYLLFFR